MHIAHATSVHPRTDTRIAVKMCRSVKAAAHDVTLVVADGLGSQDFEGIKIIDVARGDGNERSGRIRRATQTARRVMKTAMGSGADIVHFHDPELLPHATWLRSRTGPRLIFDAHEDVPKQIQGKHYLPPWSRRLLGASYAGLERGIISRVDAVLAATPTIAKRYARIHPRVESVANFPLLEELHAKPADESVRSGVCYVGGISDARGIKEVVDALALTHANVRLYLAGRFSSQSLRAEVAQRSGWGQVESLGFLAREEVRALMAGVSAGVVTFLWIYAGRYGGSVGLRSR